MSGPELRTDGYYDSGPVAWEDWHAGVHMRETHYHYWRFFADGDWMCCHRYAHDFDFWTFSENVSAELLQAAKRGRAPQIAGGLQMMIAGRFEVADNIVTTHLERWQPMHAGGHEIDRMEIKWRILEEALEPAGHQRSVRRLSFRSIPASSSSG